MASFTADDFFYDDAHSEATAVESEPAVDVLRTQEPTATRRTTRSNSVVSVISVLEPQANMKRKSQDDHYDKGEYVASKKARHIMKASSVASEVKKLEKVSLNELQNVSCVDKTEYQELNINDLRKEGAKMKMESPVEEKIPVKKTTGMKENTNQFWMQENNGPFFFKMIKTIGRDLFFN